jgi:Increased loss of mitochondrial DNA protein 1
MAIISSFSLIRGLSIFHITIAYFLLTSPQTLSEQNIVFLLGEAMHLVGVISPSKRIARLDSLWVTHIQMLTVDV